MTDIILYKFSTPEKGLKFQDGIDAVTAFYETITIDDAEKEAYLQNGYAENYQDARSFNKPKSKKKTDNVDEKTDNS